MTSMTLREKIEGLLRNPTYCWTTIDAVLSLLDEEEGGRRNHNAIFQDKQPNLLGKPPFHLRIEENIRQDLEMDAE